MINWEMEYCGGSFRGVVLGTAANWQDIDQSARAEFARRGIPFVEGAPVWVILLHNRVADLREAPDFRFDPWSNYADYSPPSVPPKRGWRRTIIIHEGQVYPQP